jgi:hypothetical protein
LFDYCCLEAFYPNFVAHLYHCLTPCWKKLILGFHCQQLLWSNRGRRPPLFPLQPPRAVWFSFNPTVRTHNLPHEIDGVQLILQTLITDTTPEPLFSKILFTLWYKAKNDYHFHRKAWTPVQVHTAAAAHLNTHTQAIASTVSVMNDV